MHLEATDYKEFELALLRAFDEPALRRLVRYCFNEDLATIVGNTSTDQLVFNLIAWAERHGRVDELVVGARERQFRQQRIKSVCSTLF